MTDQIKCEGCGICCMEMTTPPGYGVIILGYSSWLDEGDILRVREMPDELKVEIIEAMGATERSSICEELPCCWLDLSTKRCKHYDLRPSICREFEVGCEACLSSRRSAGDE